MSKEIRRRRGTTAQHATFTGAEGEFTYDTDKKCIVVHDGVTPGGNALDGFVKLNPGPGVEVQTVSSALSIQGVDQSGFGLTVGETANLNGGAVAGSTIQAVGFISSVLTPGLAGFCPLHFILGGYQVCNLTQDTTFSAGIKKPGSCLRALIVAGASSRNLTWPVGWKWLGTAAPASIASGKVALLEMFAWGTSDADVTARYTLQA